MVSPFVPKDNAAVDNGFKMVKEFVSAMNYFMMVVSDDASEYLDMYCRGMIFGNKGSSMLVRIANHLRHQELTETAAAKPKKGRKGKKGGKKDFDILGSLGKTLTEVGGTVLKNMMNGGTEGAAEGDL